MKIILHILKFKVLSFLKVQGELKPKSLLKHISTSSVYILFALSTYLFSRSIVEYLLEDIKIGNFLLHRFIFIVLFIFFITINIGNIVVSYSTFFKTTEVGFLLAKPVSFTKIFLIKFLDNFFYSSSTLLLIITAALAGYSHYYQLPWYFIFFAVFFLILPFMFIAGTLGSVILLVLLKFADRFGIKKVLATLASFYTITVILFYIFSSPVDLVTKVFQYFPNLNNYFGFLESPVIKLLPNHWVSEAMYWISTGKFYAAAWYIYLLNITSILFFLFCIFLAKKWFYKTWLIFLELTGELSLKRKRNGKKIFAFENNSALKPAREALLKREILMFIREPSQWTHFLVMCFLITIFVLSISNIDVVVLNAYDVYLKSLIYLIIYLFNAFLIASLSLRFIFPLVSLEGETIWKIRSAPINYKKLLLTRLLIYFSVIFMIGQILNFVSNYQFSAMLTAVSQLNTAFVTISLVSLNFGMGASFANYKEKNPIRLASSQGASLTFLFMIIYLVFLIILLFEPVSNYFYNIDKRNLISASRLLYSSLILGILTFIISFVSISNGVRQFNKDI
jgi:ABC-2 type transport system permease protein